MRVWVAVLALTGCRGLFGLDDPGRLTDGGGGEGTMTGDAAECWGSEAMICVRPPPSEPRTLAGTLDTGSMCDSVQNELCVVAGTDVTIANLRATGPRPLVVVASGKLDVTGNLDAASHRTGALPSGPGVDAVNATCSAFAAAPTFQGGTGNGGGAGGGAGGTFLFTGVNGGASVGVAGQAAAPVASTFRAGCAGQSGGVRAGTTAPALLAPGGKGGGAIYLIAGQRIDISGTVNASGAAGENGKCNNCAADPTNTTDLQNADAYGGGGGGAGGAITLEAPAITIASTGRVFADGGGGGQGSSRSTNGEVGTEPTGTAAARGGADPGGGGTGPNNGGNGGAGSYAAMKTGIAGSAGESSNVGGGGGGGGGAGRVKLLSSNVTNTGVVSPTP